MPPSGNSNIKNNLSYILKQLLISCSFGLPFSIISALCPTIKGGTPYSRSVAAIHSSDYPGMLYLLSCSPLGTASSWNIILVSGPKPSSVIFFHTIKYLTYWLHMDKFSSNNVTNPLKLSYLLHSLKKIAAYDWS